MSSAAPFDLRHGDCRKVMAAMAAESIDAIVSDPPYGLGFMGKEWDHGVPGEPFWAEALRVAKPGAHLVAFGGSRTFHRLTCAVEDAGWEIRDVLMWVYGSGFPKSLDVSKAIDADKTLGGSSQTLLRKRDMGDAYRPHSRAGSEGFGHGNLRKGADGDRDPMAASALSTDAARQWSGWGTALKPAYEPIILARKPLRGTVARNVQTFGTGAINVDGCRIEGAKPATTRGAGGAHGSLSPIAAQGRIEDDGRGRWPANVLLDEAAAAAVDAMSDGASRFFYTSKASGEDRGRWQGNDHPTVKPTDLMRWLCRLVTPPGGLILDPFMGSGSTGVAAVAEGFRFVGIDIERHHVDIAERRLKHATRQPALFEVAV